MKRLLTVITLMFALACFAPSAHADSWTVTLLPPSGAISGPPGSTIGWGGTISNQSATYWLMLSFLSSGAFTQAVADLSVFSYPILAPQSAISIPYIAGSQGLAEITWSVNAPIGHVNTTGFTIGADWWDGDPLNGGNFLFSADFLFVPHTATVTDPNPVSVPEPGTLLLLSAGAGMIFLRRRSA